MNCFSMRDGKCRVLIGATCAGCKFQKTPEEFEAGRMAAVENLKRKGIWEEMVEKYHEEVEG